MKKQSQGMLVTFSFSDNLPPVTFDMAKMSDENRERMLQHGAEARIGDNAAISRKQKDGAVIVVTEAMRREAVVDLVGFYESGTKEWATRASRVIARNPTWLKLAEKRGVSYDVIAAEKAAADLAELENM